MAGAMIMEKVFTLDDRQNPYLRMDFDLGKVAAGTYVVKVAHQFSGQITSGLVVVKD
jgi:hypothetical protein